MGPVEQGEHLGVALAEVVYPLPGLVHAVEELKGGLLDLLHLVLETVTGTEQHGFCVVINRYRD